MLLTNNDTLSRGTWATMTSMPTTIPMPSPMPVTFHLPNTTNEWQMITTRLPQFSFSPIPVMFHLLNTVNECRHYKPVSANFYFLFIFFGFRIH